MCILEKNIFFQNLKDIHNVVACISNVEHKTLMIREGSDANLDVENAYLILQKLYSLPADVAFKG